MRLEFHRYHWISKWCQNIYPHQYQSRNKRRFGSTPWYSFCWIFEWCQNIYLHQYQNRNKRLFVLASWCSLHWILKCCKTIYPHRYQIRNKILFGSSPWYIFIGYWNGVKAFIRISTEQGKGDFLVLHPGSSHQWYWISRIPTRWLWNWTDSAGCLMAIAAISVRLTSLLAPWTLLSGMCTVYD